MTAMPAVRLPQPEQSIFDPNLTGIKYLMANVLHLAMYDYINADVKHEPRGGRKAYVPGYEDRRIQHRSAAATNKSRQKDRVRQWFSSPENIHPFSFRVICRELGLSESYVKGNIGL
jgi:hypothetical protein